MSTKTSKVAVVTGANKGIGFGIVRRLCKRFDGVVYLTSRSVWRGRKAVADLEKEGLRPSYHQLDITDTTSIETFRDHINEKYGGIDVLVNNAAIAYKVDSKALKAPPGLQAEFALQVNYFCLVSVCDILFPLLKNGAKVVNLSRALGHVTVPIVELRDKLEDPKLTVCELSKLMEEYVEAVKHEKLAAQWGNSVYAVAVAAISALTLIQQRQLEDVKVSFATPAIWTPISDLMKDL